MGAASLACDRCHTRLPLMVLNTPDLVACPQCGNPLRFLVFPAYYRAHAPAPAGEALLIDGESSCFYHPAKKAVVTCDGCGRFLCSLCDVGLDHRHLCPKCLESAKEKRTMDTLEQERFLYDSMALTLATLGTLLMLCMPYVVVFTASAALFISVRYWNKPRSILNASGWRFVIAIGLSLIQLVFALLLLSLIFFSILYAR